MKKGNKQKEYLFVDGYNIINAWENLKKKASISLEESRLELLEILAEYHHYSGIEIIVVFDAHLVKGNTGTRDCYKGVKIIYTKENETLYRKNFGFNRQDKKGKGCYIRLDGTTTCAVPWRHTNISKRVGSGNI